MPPIDSCHNHICVSADIKAAMTESYYTLVNKSNGRFVDVIVDPGHSEGVGEIAMTNFLEKALGAKQGCEIQICKQRWQQFDTVKIQSFSNIKEDIIAIPDSSEILPLLNHFRLFEVVNPLTNDSIYVRSNHIKSDENLNPGEIKLNQKQRNMLSDNIPTRLNHQQWATLTAPVDTALEDRFKSVYNKEGNGYTLNVSIDQMNYSIKLDLKKYLSKQFGNKVILRPVIESFHYEKGKPLYRRITDFYVGKSTLSLNCRRPHECDENADVVRMTETNMLFLGLEPMDRVILRFKENEAKCHVLPFIEEKYSLTNTPDIMELSVGIPGHVRDKLKITDIQSSVKVDRDTAFIFKKSFNDQLVPIILTLLSLKFLEDLAWYISAGFITVLIPVIMYITLSTKRNMRGR